MFKEYYRPICNDKVPYPNTYLKSILGPIIWDKKDITLIMSNSRSNNIWTITKELDRFKIISTLTNTNSPNIVGYIVTQESYHLNHIANIVIYINKDKNYYE
jgi:hypothetical protein